MIHQVIALIALICGIHANNNFYNESLSLTPLARNNLLANFNFEIKSLPKHLSYYNESNDKDSIADASHYTYFPRSIGPLLEKTNTRELHLRFAQGWWDSESWGSLPVNGSKSGGTGVEVWAVIEAPTSKEALKSWSKLAVSLSAFFCASLNFIDESITTFPINAFNPDTSSFSADPANKLFLLRAAMPSEPICTENLTPFIKLLPTRGKAGISSLLDGHRVFDSLWNSMSIDIQTECDDESEACNFKMDQSISVIVDVMRSLRKKENGPIPKPVEGDKLQCDKSRGYSVWQCFPLGLPTEITYSLRDVFGRPINGGPFSSQGVPVTVNFKAEGWDISFKDGMNKVVSLSENDSTYTILGDDEVNIDFKASDSSKTVGLQTAPLHASRSLTGYSQDKGGFRVVFENPGDSAISFVYFESLPWFIRLYLSTMKATSKGQTGTYQEVDSSEYVTLSHYQPAIDRKRPSHMELLVTVPAKETLTLHYEFDKSLLLYAEYPPDANHGFSVEPAVITVLDTNQKKVYELRTTSSLVVLPTPDFSMPYNVIILTGTVISLAFGSLYNLLIKDVITEEEFEKFAAQSKLRKLRAKIKSLKSFLKSK
ncbi:Subunit of the glycosylphosphatidylinositol transamidase complex-like protein [Yamadazyma tenuis]|uniref:Gpi16 subunit, GPI transamidase component n=1 Tax=Candida tenuis (strain ATCC 10573 / BCRC 21748 / CBS 615 / JCM 9827 / NBRC 10315 / NRRL Y-1498 / VKM Y-70) TaxID=590646 RepID=G3BF54_CANTC|nr:Gpi16 subunit, GPI transamidase component [Yamadazyma tenuis ATCC 10573]EGV60640.1 Gpi16 subunit, GPI transamidase component [Yamadazyma tenuis ATCC 10573]WEJ94109.1 Subunit of the glycosylphosphatidylinositol transamidase complex-like protein [Yamadazyma tenuis]